MTIKHKESIQNFSQQKKVLVFGEKNGELSETVDAGLLQVSNMQHKLWKTLSHGASHQQQVGKHGQNVELYTHNRIVEGKGNYLCKERQFDEDHLNDENNIVGSNDHLLILAHSAELVLGYDSLNGKAENDQNHEGFCITGMSQDSSKIVSHATITEYTSARKQIEKMPVIDHVIIEEDGFQSGRRTPRLSQIRRQARSRSNLLVQQTIGESTAGHFQGRRIRLTQIRHQARSKNHSLLQEGKQRYSSGDLQDNERKRIIADIFGEEDNSKAVMRDVIKTSSAKDCSLPELDSIVEYNLTGGVNQSVLVSNEAQDGMRSIRGRMRLSQLRRNARSGDTSTLDKEHICDKG